MRAADCFRTAGGQVNPAPLARLLMPRTHQGAECSKGSCAEVGRQADRLGPRGGVQRSPQPRLSRLEASLELADPVEQFAYEHGGGSTLSSLNRRGVTERGAPSPSEDRWCSCETRNPHRAAPALGPCCVPAGR